MNLGFCTAPPCQLILDDLVIRVADCGLDITNDSSIPTDISVGGVQIDSPLIGICFTDSLGSGSAVDITRSRIHGSTNSLYLTGTPGPLRMTHSQLSGGPTTGPASLVTCAGVWDENFVFSASSCP
jgi:hypothetical protein